MLFGHRGGYVPGLSRRATCKVRMPSPMSSRASGPQLLWPVMQGFDGKGQRLSVNISLALTKVFNRPGDDLGKIQLRICSKADFPDHAHAGAVALLATDLRWSRSDALVSNDLKRPAAMSADPSCTAARSASRRWASSASRCSTKRSPSRSTSLAFC